MEDLAATAVDPSGLPGRPVLVRGRDSRAGSGESQDGEACDFNRSRGVRQQTAWGRDENSRDRPATPVRQAAAQGGVLQSGSNRYADSNRTLAVLPPAELARWIVVT